MTKEEFLTPVTNRSRLVDSILREIRGSGKQGLTYMELVCILASDIPKTRSILTKLTGQGITKPKGKRRGEGLDPK